MGNSRPCKNVVSPPPSPRTAVRGLSFSSDNSPPSRIESYIPGKQRRQPRRPQTQHNLTRLVTMRPTNITSCDSHATNRPISSATSIQSPEAPRSIIEERPELFHSCGFVANGGGQIRGTVTVEIPDKLRKRESPGRYHANTIKSNGTGRRILCGGVQQERHGDKSTRHTHAGFPSFPERWV